MISIPLVERPRYFLAGENTGYNSIFLSKCRLNLGTIFQVCNQSKVLKELMQRTSAFSPGLLNPIMLKEKLPIKA